MLIERVVRPMLGACCFALRCYTGSDVLPSAASLDTAPLEVLASLARETHAFCGYSVTTDSASSNSAATNGRRTGVGMESQVKHGRQMARTGLAGLDHKNLATAARLLMNQPCSPPLSTSPRVNSICTRHIAMYAPLACFTKIPDHMPTHMQHMACHRTMARA